MTMFDDARFVQTPDGEALDVYITPIAAAGQAAERFVARVNLCGGVVVERRGRGVDDALARAAAHAAASVSLLQTALSMPADYRAGVFGDCDPGAVIATHGPILIAGPEPRLSS